MQQREDWSNPAHRGAFDKGARARREGASLAACPYRDVRRADGRLTGSRGFMKAWRAGWRSAAPEAGAGPA